MNTLKSVTVDSDRQLCLKFTDGSNKRCAISDEGTVKLAGEFSPAGLNQIARAINKHIRQERVSDEAQRFCDSE